MPLLYCSVNQLLIHLIPFVVRDALLANLRQKMISLQYHHNYVTAHRTFN